MRASQLFFPTLREVPRDAELISHQLLLRGGYVRNLAAGVYSYLPLGWRVHEKLSRIVREEINSFGGQEIHMPVLIPRELLEESGRAGVSVLFSLKDKNQREFFLGFTHEEVVTDIVRGYVKSWKQLPIYLYQIQTKERDEPRPRGGLVRGREFTMFDGYSFSAKQLDLDEIYRLNYEAYERIFRRCGLEYLAVEADPGAIGGSENHEFMVLTESGEDTVLRCDGCGYAANAERAEVPAPAVTATDPTEIAASELIATPGSHTIEEVGAYLKLPTEVLIKSMVCVAGGKPVMALVRGDRELNLPKFARVLGCGDVALADAETVKQVTGSPVGFAGPVGLAVEMPIYADAELNSSSGYVVGANQEDTHRINAVPGRDFNPTAVADIRTAVAGDRCPRCNAGRLSEARGIEVGHIFKLGLKYSKAMGAQFQSETSEMQHVIMGCYGLGVSRTMAAAIEAHHDEAGIVWPITIAPFTVGIIMAGATEEQRDAGLQLHDALEKQGIDVLLDDRNERIGVKFKDLDLIGIPIQVVVGKGLAEGNIELGLRRDKSGRKTIPYEGAAEAIALTVREEIERLGK